VASEFDPGRWQPNPRLFGPDLPLFLTIGEIVAAINVAANENLAKARAPHGKARPAPSAE